MYESIDDLTAPWIAHGPRLAREMLAYADELDLQGRVGVADRIRAIIRCEYSALPPVRPPLGDPPTLRPAVPPNSHSGRGVIPEPGS